MTNNNFINGDIDVLKVINLLDYDQNFDLLMEQLETVKKQQYAPSEKIVILHNDTEYFYQGNKLGFTMHNLLTCWRDLDIPYHVMVVYTNHSDLDSAVETFIVHPKDRPLIVPTIVNNDSWRAILAIPEFDLSKQISQSAFCLMRAGRQHRMKFFQYVSKHGLFDYIKINYKSDHYAQRHKPWKMPREHNRNNIKNDQLSALDSSGQLSNIIYTRPHRINETCFAQSRYKDIVELNSVTVCPRSDLQGPVSNFYNDFFLEVVAETVFDYPHVFVSEKTLKPLLFKTPFVLFGAAGTLEYLKTHNFKTFHDFWDESYDSESDPHLRFLKCCETVKKLVTRPLGDLKEMYHAMFDVLEHNHCRLLEYVETEYKPLYNKIKS